jgi:hypothetical protein
MKRSEELYVLPILAAIVSIVVGTKLFHSFFAAITSTLLGSYNLGEGEVLIQSDNNKVTNMEKNYDNQSKAAADNGDVIDQNFSSQLRIALKEVNAIAAKDISFQPLDSKSVKLYDENANVTNLDRYIVVDNANDIGI